MSTKPIKAIGFAQGQFGDLAINTVAARAFKEQYPNSRLTLGLNRRYESALPLFGASPTFSDYHIYETYEGWPGGEDNLFLAKNQFDMVYHAMPQRANEATWFKTEHQCQSICSVYGLTPPDNLQCELTKWFDTPDYRGYIGLQWIGGLQDWPNKKSFSIARAQEVVSLILSLGFKVLQFGAPEEAALEGTERFVGSYFESMKAMLGCRMLVTVDTGRCWYASAYSFPTLGLYSESYYTRQYIGAIQPINPNAQYLSAELVNDIPLETIAASVKEMTS